MQLLPDLDSSKLILSFQLILSFPLIYFNCLSFPYIFLLLPFLSFHVLSCPFMFLLFQIQLKIVLGIFWILHCLGPALEGVIMVMIQRWTLSLSR